MFAVAADMKWYKGYFLQLAAASSKSAILKLKDMAAARRIIKCTIMQYDALGYMAFVMARGCAPLGACGDSQWRSHQSLLWMTFFTLWTGISFTNICTISKWQLSHKYPNNFKRKFYRFELGRASVYLSDHRQGKIYFFRSMQPTPAVHAYHHALDCESHF